MHAPLRNHHHHLSNSPIRRLQDPQPVSHRCLPQRPSARFIPLRIPWLGTLPMCSALPPFDLFRRR
eukprot:51589-Eustigmatos_ZCMA.PRE.1